MNDTPIGRENVPECSLGKEGDEKCMTNTTRIVPAIFAEQEGLSVSQAAEVTKAASSPTPSEKVGEVIYFAPFELWISEGKTVRIFIPCRREFGEYILTPEAHEMIDNLKVAFCHLKPNWLPVSQCDLKPGEAFWAHYSNGTSFVHQNGFANVSDIHTATDITHYLRATGQYQIPKPPVVEKEDVSWRKWWNEFGHIYSDVPEETSRKMWESMEASREALKEKGNK